LKTARVFWTPLELDTLRELYPDLATAEVAAHVGRSIGKCYQKAAALGLRKSAAFMESDKAGRIQRGHQNPNMIASRFKPGQPVWNKGMKGWAAPGTEATRFKPGIVPANRQQVGALRINSDGQLDIKLYEGLRAWVQLSHYTWFVEHGTWVPRGMCLRFINGDVHDPRIENLRLLTRAENMRLNSVHTIYPPEVAKLVQLRGALNRQINNRKKVHHESHQHSSPASA
jgi:hypothetical protein